MKNLKPITRQETLLAKVAGQDVPDLVPITRDEFFLAKAAGKDVPTLEPITREEYFLADVVEAIEGGGGGSDLGTKTISANGVYKASDDSLDGYSKVTVDVPASAVDSGTKNISANGSHDVTGYASASVSVPNSYSAGDEGKVVSNGALVAQSSDTVTENDTYDTTLIDSLTVNVSGGAGEWTTDGIATNAEPSGALTLGSGVTVIQEGAFERRHAITSITGNAVTEIKANAFYDCSGITSASFPNLVTMRSAVFENARGMTSFSAPNLERAEGNTFRNWTAFTGNLYLPKLTFFGNCYGSAFQQVRFPILTTLNGADNFRDCRQLKVLDLGSVGSIPYESTFSNTIVLEALILRKTSAITTLGRGSWGTGQKTLYDGTCKIYVPQALISTYQTATNWSNLPNASTQFVALEGSPYEDPEFIYAG